MPSSSSTLTAAPPFKGMQDELLAYCLGEEITEDGLQEIIHRWGWSPDKKEIKLNYYFFMKLLRNKKVTKGMVATILHYFPKVIRIRCTKKRNPLHLALSNTFVASLDIAKLLVEKYPQIVANYDVDNMTAFHCLCFDSYADDMAKMEILNFLLQKNEGALKIATRLEGFLPIHDAARANSLPVPFIQKLIERYPESVLKYTNVLPGQISGLTPLHIACDRGHPKMVKMLVNFNPACLDLRTGSHNGGYPINMAITAAYRGDGNTNPASYSDIVRFLVNYPKVPRQEFQGYLPLHWACLKASKVRGLEEHLPATSLELVTILFDAYPGAIRHSALNQEMRRRDTRLHPKVREFLHYQHNLSLPFNEVQEMYGPFPLHSVIMKNDCLGSIKLLVEGNPAAVQTLDNDGAIPLHLAVQHHHSIEAIQFLIKFDRSTLIMTDSEGNTALHHACRGANYEVIALLLEKYDAVSITTQNLRGKLPIELLFFETDSALDRNSSRYTATIFHLLRSYPNTLMKWNTVNR